MPSSTLREDLAEIEMIDRWTTCFFGECGTGKSTDLSLISKIYAKHYQGAKGQRATRFKSQKSSRAITKTVQVMKTGNMTLIDTPGTNDPDKKRPDRQIQAEVINTIRSILTSKC